MSNTERPATMSLLPALAHHVILLLTFRHRGQGLGLTHPYAFYAILALPILTLCLITTETSTLLLRALVIFIVWFMNPRFIQVGVALIFASTDLASALCLSLGFPTLETIFDLWASIAFLVFLYFSPRSSKQSEHSQK